METLNRALCRLPRSGRHSRINVRIRSNSGRATFNPLAGKVQGVLIAELESRSPAARAGLRKGDVILAVNQQRVASPADLQPLAAGGDALLINLLRGREELVLALR